MPVHNTGKVVTINGKFFVFAGILVLNYAGVYGLLLIRNMEGVLKSIFLEINWWIYTQNGLGTCSNLQRVHWWSQKDDKYVKIHILRWALVEDHTIYCFVEGEWKSFKYIKPMWSKLRMRTCLIFLLLQHSWERQALLEQFVLMKPISLMIIILSKYFVNFFGEYNQIFHIVSCIYGLRFDSKLETCGVNVNALEN